MLRREARLGAASLSQAGRHASHGLGAAFAEEPCHARLVRQSKLAALVAEEGELQRGLRNECVADRGARWPKRGNSSCRAQRMGQRAPEADRGGKHENNTHAWILQVVNPPGFPPVHSGRVPTRAWMKASGLIPAAVMAPLPMTRWSR